jgi:AraC family transcriptional regulator
MQGCFYFWGDRALYVGLDVPATMHAHHAQQVCIGLSGGVRLRTPGARWEEYDGVIIPPDQPHVSEYVPGTSIATLWIEPQGGAARCRRPKEGVPPIVRIDRAKLDEVVPLLLDCWRRGSDPQGAAALADAIVETVVPFHEPRPRIDPRIARARALLASAPDRRASVGRVAAAVALSPSRLEHLFRAQIGLPMRRYLLWLRLRDAIVTLAHGASITEAAYAAGFADGPHLSRTFRRMLGFTATEALQVSRFVHAAPATA